MTEALKNWLPITKRNRVALGFALLALFMFVAWNCMPNYNIVDYTQERPKFERDGWVFMMLWPEVFDPDHYLTTMKSPDVDGFLNMAASMAVMLNALIVLALVPLWKILHASNYLRLPVAVVNLIGGGVVMKFFFESLLGDFFSPYQSVTLLLISLTMLAVFAAMVLFKNELDLRNDLEVKKTMGENEM